MTDNATPMSIFITGATGALARLLTRRLVVAGHIVTGMTLRADGAKLVRADGALPVFPDPYRAGELRSAMAIKKPSIVINLAPMLANHVPYRPAPWDTRLLAEGTPALIEAAESFGIDYFLHSSYTFTQATLDPAEERMAPLAPLIEAARVAERSVIDATVTASVLRFGFIYGPESVNLRTIYDAMRVGDFPPFGPHDREAHFIHLDDAIATIMLALEKRPNDVAFDVVDDDPTSPPEFLMQFVDALGVRPPTNRSVQGRGLPTLKRRQQIALMHLDTHVDNAEAKAQLGWTPRFPDFRSGIEDTLMTWRAQDDAATAIIVPGTKPADQLTD
ncbi:MAG: NAD(P)-dependent oxidoreductase [Chloroflexi bacterium]|nr:NAD(P)-dependent oxidoreductase [Chloroflexota bacterium]